MSEFKQLFGSTGRSSNTIWMSSTDLMSGLMIVFMFIAIAFMVFVERNEQKSYQIAQEWKRSKIKLLKALHQEFDDDLINCGAEIDDKNISMKFLSPEILFEPAKSSVRPEFQKILNNFFPRYLETLDAHKDIIAEIRIEGHTSKEWKNKSDKEAYLKNMELSQDRTRSVLNFCINQIGHRIAEELLWAREKITANGLSSSYPYKSKGKYDKIKSRRVEFKVRTDAEERIERILPKR